MPGDLISSGALLRRRVVSGSALGHAAKCAPSQVLPRIRGAHAKATIGTAYHEHLRDRAIFGISEAMNRLDLVCAAHKIDEREAGFLRARARQFEWSPPAGAVPELSLCLLEDGSVVRVAGGRGDYRDLPADAVLPMQLDLMWAEPAPLYAGPDGAPVCPTSSVLWCVDWKTGDEAWVDPVEHNAQALAAALLGARYTGATRAIAGIIFPGKGAGLWDVQPAPMGPDELARVEATIRGVVANVERQRALYESGIPLEYVEGPWCTYCDSRTYCPARNASLREFLGDPQAIEPGELSEAQATRIAELLPAIEAFGRQAKAALVDYVDARGKPLVLRDRRLWGPHPHTETEIDAEIAIAAAEPEIGTERAERLRAELVASVSRARIEAMVKEAHAERGISRKLAPAMRTIMARVQEGNGIRKVHTTRYSAHKPAAAPQFSAELPAPASAPRALSAPVIPPGIEIDGDPEEA